MSKWKPDENPYEKSIGAVFILEDIQKELHGRITLNQDASAHASATKIFETKFVFIPQGYDLHGRSEKGHVSLLSCFGGGVRPTNLPPDQPLVTDGGSTSITLRSEYAVFGNEHLRSNDPVIRGVVFAFDEIHKVLDDSHGHASYDAIFDPDSRIIEAIERYKPNDAASLSEHDAPMIFYFTGKYGILPTTSTVLGSISARRALGVTMTEGAEVSDAPYINIDFDDDPVTLSDVVGRVNVVRQFFGWMVGYAPRWRRLHVYTAKKHPERSYRVNDKGHFDPGFDVFTPDHGGTTASHDALIPGGHVLISPAHQPDHFVEVMKKWLERNREGESANRLFFASARGMPTTALEDRMVAAANVFDHIPITDRPSKRAAMLDVALYRYQKVIRPHLEFPHLDKVIRSAVNCRHHITHGGSDRETHGVDYSDFSSVVFLTDALRFVYGASELIKCGWDMNTWLRGHLKWRHPFGSFVDDYRDRLVEAMPSRYREEPEE